MANTHAWLKRHGIKMKRFKSGSDDDTIGLVGQKLEVRGKNKDNASSSGTILKLKLKSKEETRESSGKEKVVIQENLEVEDDQQEDEVHVLLEILDTRSTLAETTQEFILVDAPSFMIDSNVDSFSIVLTPPVPNMPHDNMAGVFSYVSHPGKPMIPSMEGYSSLSDFDRFMSESMPHITTRPVPIAIQTEAPAIVSITTCTQSNISQVTSEGTPAILSDLPSWLSAVVPKRKKHDVLPDIFDFEQLKQVKAKGIKRAKMVSRVRMDKNKTKYVEIAEPLIEKPRDEMQLVDFKITRLDLGKQTHARLINDAQESVEFLAQECDELKRKKNQLKEHNELLMAVI